MPRTYPTFDHALTLDPNTHVMQTETAVQPTQGTSMTRPSAPPVTSSSLAMSRMTQISLIIKKVQTASANYDPAHAEIPLITKFQETMDSMLEEDAHVKPQSTRAKYCKPDPMAPYGYFIMSFPEVLLPLAQEHLIPYNDRDFKHLRFIGDGKGNNYELIFGEAAKLKEKRPAFVSTWNKTSITWCHIIPPDNTKLSERACYEAATEHLAKFGLYTSKDPNAFKPTMDPTGAQFAGKYMCGYDIVRDKVPLHPDGTYNLEGIRQFIVEDELFTFWQVPENIHELFRVCPKCYRSAYYCQCKRDGKETKSRSQREDAITAAKRRKQVMQTDFSFK
jgi:hypothetical protein